MTQKRICIVADWLPNQSGAERVITAISKTWPDAPIFTTVYKLGSVPSLEGRDIRPNWFQKNPGKEPVLLPILPHAIASHDLSGYDLIISFSSAFNKCIQKMEQVQVCFFWIKRVLLLCLKLRLS